MNQIVPDVETLREKLIDYYGSGMGVDFLMSVSFISEIEDASDERIIELAREAGLIGSSK